MGDIKEGMAELAAELKLQMAPKTKNKQKVGGGGNHGCLMAIARFLKSYVFGPSGFWTMAPLRYAAKFDPFLSLDCAPTPSTLAQSKERKGSNFAIWQPWRELLCRCGLSQQPEEGPASRHSVLQG